MARWHFPLKSKTLLWKPICRSSKKLPDRQYAVRNRQWIGSALQAKPNRNATLPGRTQEAVPNWYVEQAQCAVYESTTDPARLILTVQGVLQDETGIAFLFSGSSEYYFLVLRL